MNGFTRRALLSSMLTLGACGQSLIAPLTNDTDEASAGASYEMAFDPLDMNRVTYTFNDLDAAGCRAMTTTDGLYEDLVFPSPAQVVPCVNENGTVGLRPSGISGTTSEVRVGLPRPAEWVSVESFMIMFGSAPTLVAYDASGAEIGRSSDASLFSWRTLRVDGMDVEIASIGLLMPQWVADLDNLTVRYVPQDASEPDPEPGPSDPVTKADCFGGGWEAYGFKNQGQCVRFVETGKDSR